MCSYLPLVERLFVSRADVGDLSCFRCCENIPRKSRKHRKSRKYRIREIRDLRYLRLIRSCYLTCCFLVHTLHNSLNRSSFDHFLYPILHRSYIHPKDLLLLRKVRRECIFVVLRTSTLILINLLFSKKYSHYLLMCIFCCTFAPKMVVYVPPNKVFFTH